jgi:hypothetical protein
MGALGKPRLHAASRIDQLRKSFIARRDLLTNSFVVFQHVLQ